MCIVMSMVIQKSSVFFFCLGFLDVIAATDAVAAAVCLFCFVFWFMIMIMINEKESMQTLVYRNDAIFDEHQCGICQMMENQPNKNIMDYPKGFAYFLVR